MDLSDAIMSLGAAIMVEELRNIERARLSERAHGALGEDGPHPLGVDGYLGKVRLAA